MKNAPFIALCLLIPLMIGHGCGSDFKLHDGLSGASQGVHRQLNTDFKPLTETKTVSLAYSKQVLDNMVACLGLEKASSATENEWQERKGSLSEFGFVTEVTGPMLMAVVAIAGEACSDLIARESLLAPDSRRIFREADFSSNAGPIANSEMTLMTRRLTRSCWQREPTEAEVSEIVGSVEEAVFKEASGGGASQKGLLMTCTAVLASLESIQL